MPLHDVPDWSETMSCAPLAICAATGQSRAIVEGLIRRCAEAEGLDAGDLSSSAPRHWACALQELGVAYRIETLESYDWLPLNAAFGLLGSSEVVLIVAYHPTGEGHVFATDGSSFVDYYTQGRVARFEGVAAHLLAFRSKYIVHLQY